MPIRNYKPTTPSRRNMSVLTFEELSKVKPERSLLVSLKKHAGRNANGRITVRHQGGGNRKKYRLVDFKRNEDADSTVMSIEYDPNRSANIALIRYISGKKSYIIAPDGLKVGDVIKSSSAADIKPGNCLPLSAIPLGTLVHNVELNPGRGAQMVRAAGMSAQVMAKENGYAQLRLPSGEVRMVRLECKATIGIVGNFDHENVSLGKAGKSRHLGIRPSVRGAVMNPCDHPHGGGEGKAPVGRSGPVTPWGKPTMGYKTRANKNKSNKFIVKRRNVK